MNIAIETFVQHLTGSGVLSADRVAGYLHAMPNQPPQTDDLAAALVRDGVLTSFQAERFCQGECTGLTLGEYLILDRLGIGGMGHVFVAEHRRMGRRVALKTLAPALAADPDTILRFQREVRAAALLSHPHIVTAFDAGEAHGIHYFVMELVEGIDLARFIRQKGPLSVPQAVGLIRQAAAGLQYAHHKGIIHRDIKPANLLIDIEGHLKILDMGLARLERQDPDDQLTQAGTFLGTVDYMSPEQALDTKHAGVASDIYSLGCVLHFLLIGGPLYAADTDTQKLLAHRDQPIPTLGAIRLDVSPGLEELFRQMVAKTPEERFRSMAEVIKALDACPLDDPPAQPVSAETDFALALDPEIKAPAHPELPHPGTAASANLPETVAGTTNAPLATEPQTAEPQATAPQATERFATEPFATAPPRFPRGLVTHSWWLGLLALLTGTALLAASQWLGQ